MDTVFELLERRRWKEDCLRTNIAAPEDIVVSASGFRRVRLASNVLSHREEELRAAIEASAPFCVEGLQIVVNKNVTCRPHTDGANVGPSHCLFLGDFEGGALVFADGKRFTQKRTWHTFDGGVQHWNEPHEGTKYSVILYRPGKPSKSRLIHARRRPTSPRGAC